MTDNTAAIIVHEHTRQFHLTNGRISYVFHADGQGKLINLYFGAAVPDREDFSYLTEVTHSPTTTCRIPGNLTYTLEGCVRNSPNTVAATTGGRRWKSGRATDRPSPI